MIISNTKKFVFVHIPKTGGTSIKKVLGKHATVGVYQHNPPPGVAKQANPRLWKHAPARDLRQHMGYASWAEMFSFGIVRNPFDWMVSAYFYIRKDTHDPRHQIANKLGFPEFVEWFEKSNPYRHPIRNGQWWYLSDRAGNQIVSKYYKLEEIGSAWKSISVKVQVNSFLPHTNKTSHRDYRSYYTPRSVSLVAGMFSDDFKRFGYTWT